MRSGSTADKFYTREAKRPLALLHLGFADAWALCKYVQVRHLVMVKYPRTGDESELRQAVCALEQIIKFHHRWAEKYGVDRMRDDILKATGLRRAREQQAERMF